MLTIRYEYDNYQRKRLVSKQKMRSKGIKSPNMADALLMAVSAIDRIKRPKYDFNRSIHKPERGYGWNLREKQHV
jgi:hypothetical protein